MADFNVTPQAERPESFLGYSRGIDSEFRNDGLGQLFSNLAQFGEQAVEGADAMVKEDILDKIYEESEAIGDEFGVGDATLFQSDAEGKKPLPAQLGAAGENLDRLQSAYQQGALRESHYWARLNSMVRQLRQKYPGYREEIDQMVSGVTGAKPANALRNALFNEWAASASGENSMADLEDWAIKNGHLPADYYARQEQGTPYTHTELKSYVARRNATEVDRAARRAALAEEMEHGTLNEQTALRTFRIETIQYANTIMTDVNSVIGNNFSVITQRVEEARRAVERGEPIAQQSLETIRGQIIDLRTSMQQKLHAFFTEPLRDGDPNSSYAAYVDPKKAEEVIQQALRPMLLMEDALVNENWGLLKSVTASVEARKLDAEREIIDGIPLLPTLNAAKDLIGPEAMDLLLSTSPELQVPLVKSLVDYANARSVATPGANIVQDFQLGEQSDMPPEYYNALIDTWTNSIKQLSSGKLPVEAIQKKVDYMFGPSSMAVLEHLDSPSRMEYFRKVASPGVTKQMQKLRDMGDLQSWDTYQQWVSRSFMVLMQNKVQTIQNAGQSIFNPGMQVLWDNNASQFRLVDTQPNKNSTPILGNLIDAGGGLDALTAQSAVNDLNTAIRTVKPIIEDNGGEAGPEVYELLRQMGFSPDEQDDFVSALMGSIAVVFGVEEEPIESTDMDEGELDGNLLGDS